jgi:mannose-6-phosphate isomerase-like protein (cupin superfamily)
MNSFTHIPKELVDKTLAEASKPGQKRVLSPLKELTAEAGVPMNILEDCEVVAEAEVHKNATDLWQCLEGEVKFTLGGELIEPEERKDAVGVARPNELKGKGISGGKEIILKPGDWLHIAAGVPHQHECKRTARLVIIKIPAV